MSLGALIRIIFSLNEIYECPETDFELSVKDSVLAAQLRLDFEPLDEGNVLVPSLGLSFPLVRLSNYFN
jgi:hypothetical protein